MLEGIKNQGIEDTEIALVDHIYQGCTGKIVLHKQSDEFSIRKGARQGYTISAKLFRACSEGEFRKLDYENTVRRINVRLLEPFQITRPHYTAKLSCETPVKML